MLRSMQEQEPSSRARLLREEKTGSAGQKNRVVFLALSLLTMIAANISTPTLYLYAIELGASVAFVGIIASATSAARLVSRIPMGLASDRFGRRSLIRIGALGTAGSLLWLYLAREPPHVLLGSVANALGLTSIFTIGLTMASEIYASKKTTGVSLFALVSSLAMVVAPGICSLLLLVLRIRDTYLIGGAIGFGGILCSIPLVASPNSSASFNASGSLRSVLKDERIRLAIVLEAFFSLAINAIFVFLPVYLSERFQLTSAEISFLFTLYSTAMMAVRLPLPKILRKIRETTVISLGYLSYALALLIVSFSNTMTHFSAIVSLSGIAHGVIFPATAVVVSRSRRQDLGLANSIYLGAGDVVSMLAPLVFVSLIGMLGYSSFYVVISGITFIAVLYALGKRKTVSA
jgi:MFS family permease